MISDAPVVAPVSDAGGRATLPWITWLVSLVSALNGLLTAFTVGASNAVTITNPAGLAFGTDWQTWTPAITASGSMSVSSVSISAAQYLRIGPVVFFHLYFTATLGGTASNEVFFSAPVNLSGPSGAVYPVVVDFSNGFAQWNTSSLVAMSGNGGGNYGLGTHSWSCTGFYRCA